MESKIQHRSTYLPKKNRLTDIDNRVFQEGGGWGGKDWEFSISRGKLLYIGWINNKVLLYSPRNDSQYPVRNHNGKKYEKGYIYIYIYTYTYIYIHTHTSESFFCIEENNTTLKISYALTKFKNNKNKL